MNGWLSAEDMGKFDPADIVTVDVDVADDFDMESLVVEEWYYDTATGVVYDGTGKTVAHGEPEEAL